MFKNDKHSDLCNNNLEASYCLFLYELVRHTLLAMHQECFYTNSTNSEGRTTVCCARKTGLGMMLNNQLGAFCFRIWGIWGALVSKDMAILRKLWWLAKKKKKSTKTITGFNWRLILSSTTLIFTFNKICLKEAFAQYSVKKLYKENFKPRLPLKSCTFFSTHIVIIVKV